MISQEELKRFLSYDPLTGYFTWRMNRSRTKKGTIAGTTGSDGYIYIVISRKHYVAHRLAWFYMTGEWPKEEIDHKNKQRADNVFDNLREATCSENKANAAVRTHSASQVKGVYFDARRPKKPWQAYVTKNKKRTSIGYYATKEEAADARNKKAFELFGDFTRYR